MSKFNKTGIFFGSILVIYLALIFFFTLSKDLESVMMIGVVGIVFALIGIFGSLIWLCMFIDRCFNQKSITFKSAWLPTVLCGFNVVVLILFGFGSTIFR